MTDNSASLSKGELALAALRRGVEKAQRQKVVTEHDLHDLTQQLEVVDLLGPQAGAHAAEWEPVLQGDPNLALALVRGQVESRMRQLLSEATQPNDLQHVLLLLTKQGTLTKVQLDVLSKTIGILNSAVHGAIIDRAACDWARDVGFRILVLAG